MCCVVSSIFFLGPRSGLLTLVAGQSRQILYCLWQSYSAIAWDHFSAGDHIDLHSYFQSFVWWPCRPGLVLAGNRTHC